ncbi:MAG: hypothetical protein HC876_05445, partial [Chloroflexaceae bacterium]|nr:hypothetical protein [Chloroflexaceae bacterium]
AQDELGTLVRIEGSQIIIDATVEEREGATAEDLQLSASILGGNGQTGEESTQRNVTLHQVAPGEYRAVIQAPNPGSYLVQLHGQEGGQITVQSTMGMVVPYSSEYRQDQNNPALLAELASITGGSTLREPIEAFARNDLAAVSRAQEIALPLLILALLLLPLDIAVRRLMLRWSDITGIRSTPPSRPAAPIRDDSMMTRIAQARATRPREPSTPPPPPATPPRPAEPPRPTPPVQATPPAAPSPMAPPPPPRTEESENSALARLRAAKERARKRARGEE